MRKPAPFDRGIIKVSYAFCVHVEIESFLHHGPVKVPIKFIVGDMNVTYNTLRGQRLH
jgi:hypothetical protein